MTEYEGSVCIFGFEAGNPRKDQEAVRPLPSHLGKKALKRYLKAGGGRIHTVREATITVSFTYETHSSGERLKDADDVASELGDSVDSKIVKHDEKVVGYRCDSTDCENCPRLVNKGVYTLLRGKK
jgi:hypothetical protein